MNKIEIPASEFKKMFLQEGGQVQTAQKKEQYKDLTGQYLHALPSQVEEQANAEIEGGEHVATQGKVVKAEGKKHSEGGMDVRLESGDRVLSDYIKVDKELAKKLSEQYDIKVTPFDTYAKVLDKYLKKIGHTEAVEEVEEYIKKLDLQKETVKDESTLALNSEYLMDEINEENNKVKELEPQKKEMFELLYSQQEASKEAEEKTNKMQNGGMIQDLMQKYNITPERVGQIFKNGGELPKYQDGKRGYYSQANPYFMQNPGYEGAMKDWYNDQPYKAEYELGDVQETAKRFKELAETSGTPYTEADFKDMKSLNALAGRIQQQQVEKNPDLVTDYGSRVEPTRQGLQYLVDNKLIDHKKLGIQIVNGKVARGSYDTLDAKAFSEIEGVVNNLPEDKKKQYAVTNYKDNLAYFRGINKRDQYLPKEDYEKFLEENKGKRLGDSNTYRTDKEGVYLSPYTDNQGQIPTESPTPPSSTPLPAPNTPKAQAEEEKRRMGLLLMPERMYQNPSFLAPMKFSPTIYTGERVEISPEQQLMEINRQQQATKEQLAQMPDAQRAATLASMDANLATASSKAISDAERYNAQAREKESYENAEVKTRQSLADNQSAAQYQQLMGRELAGFDANMQAQNNMRFQDQFGKWSYVNQMNRNNAVNSDINFNGSTYEVRNPADYIENLIEQKKPKARLGGRFKK